MPTTATAGCTNVAADGSEGGATPARDSMQASCVPCSITLTLLHHPCAACRVAHQLTLLFIWAVTAANAVVANAIVFPHFQHKAGTGRLQTYGAHAMHACGPRHGAGAIPPAPPTHTRARTGGPHRAADACQAAGHTNRRTRAQRDSSKPLGTPPLALCSEASTEGNIKLTSGVTQHNNERHPDASMCMGRVCVYRS